MNFSYILYEQQEVYSAKYESKKEVMEVNLTDLIENFLNESDKIWVTQVRPWEGFGSAIDRTLREKKMKYDTNNFHNLSMLYPTLYDDSEGNIGLANAIQDFVVEQKVNLLEGKFQLFQNSEGSLSILFNGKKRGPYQEKTYLLVVDIDANFQLYNFTQLTDKKLNKI